MGIKTQILYCDSTVNPIVGCDGEGCELFKSNICYAQALVNRYAGCKGWPQEFTKPAFFPKRLQDAIRWPDLTGTDRPDKPWLNGYPRVIFLNDLSDTFTRSAPENWLADFVDDMEASPHIWLLLTKQVTAMLEFFWKIGRVPKNFWIGTTVTSLATINRAVFLSTMRQLAMTWLSIEPLLDLVTLPEEVLHNIDWVCVGGASGPNAPGMNLNWARQVRDDCKEVGVPLFIKQLGSVWEDGISRSRGKGENWHIWPDDLRVREIPQFPTRTQP